MHITRWQPLGSTWPEINRLREEMKRMFDRFGLGERGGWETSVFPALDMWQDESTLFVEAELPGMSLEDLEIYVTGENRLSLKGKRDVPVVERGAWHRRERKHGSFARVVDLPYPVDAGKVEASFRNGILTIALPKLEQAKPRRIKVQIN